MEVMSSLPEFVPDRNKLKFELRRLLVQDKHSRFPPRSKGKGLKIIHNKELKRKLKKYKLRQDGQEDQDVIDVSHTLLSLLKIKSPNKLKDCQEISHCFVEQPANYIIKMVKRKQTCNNLNFEVPKKKDDSVTSDCNETTNNVSPFEDSQEKKSINAFSLMMESRNKSIGSNSPGKEQSNDDEEVKQRIHNKSLRDKRTSLLQKLAESKGSLRNKEIEECQDEFIEKEMKKRAKKLKAMLLNGKSNYNKKCKKLVKKKIYKDTSKSSSLVAANKPKKVCLIDLFNDSDSNVSDSSQQLLQKGLQEGDDFLKKLTPSIRKKENMLCYFNKIPKESVPCSDNDSSDIIYNDVIKVKLNKKTIRKSHNKCSSNDKIENFTFNSVKNSEHIINDTVNSIVKNDAIDKSPLNGRAKRKVKKPLKYMDNFILTSSDEECAIFTPKKRKANLDIKKVDLEPKLPSSNTIIITSERAEKVNFEQKLNGKHQGALIKPIKETFGKGDDKPVKLAPIFKVKIQEENEAKMNFLRSGVPEKLRKLQKVKTTQIANLTAFTSVIHVQQDNSSATRSYKSAMLQFEEYSDDEINAINEFISFKKLLDLRTNKNETFTVPSSKLKTMLKDIKQTYIRFPVYRTYKLFKAKKAGEFREIHFSMFDNSNKAMNNVTDIPNEDLDYESWTSKYRPFKSSEIVGNFESIKELKKWLMSWTENNTISKVGDKSGSESSDFYQSDSEGDEIKSMNNLIILSGPVGSGKTSSVYALAAELAIKVIEVNASSKRTGKRMLQDLQEATQSHKVNRGKVSIVENSQNNVDVINFELVSNIKKKRGRPKKPKKSEEAKTLSKLKDVAFNMSQPCTSQESVGTGMSLILVDDADIVFEQDDGFGAAISQLVQSSKRPVILITSSLTCPHLQRYTKYGKIIYYKPFLPKMLGTWLDIMCLADTGVCCPGLAAKILDFYHGDIRKAINFMHFYIYTQSHLNLQEHAISQTINDYTDVEDESSSVTWENSETVSEQFSCDTVWNTIWKSISNKYFYNDHYAEIHSIWWSLPNTLNVILQDKTKFEVEKSQQSKSSHAELQSIACLMDNFSVTDLQQQKQHISKRDIFLHPWQSTEANSVCEYDNMESYCKHHSISSDISCTLISEGIKLAEKSFGYTIDINKSVPSLTVHREKEKILSRHHTLTDSLNPSSLLDRKALALDYWSTCRTICRIEKAKSDNNSKRNNRYCHYLKSLKVMYRNDSFDNLADSLLFGEERGQST